MEEKNQFVFMKQGPECAIRSGGLKKGINFVEDPGIEFRRVCLLSALSLRNVYSQFH
jgi:hypothetical protein